MAKVLIVEDERDLSKVLVWNLSQAGHDVVAVATGAEGLLAASREKPDVILLDLMLPDIPGTDVCRAVRRSAELKNTAIIMVTAKGEEIDRVVGFELGADDYVVKPFSTRELLLRVDAVLRRSTRESPQEKETVEFGRLKIDRGAHRVFVDTEEVELTALEFRLLTTLHDRKNRVQTRARLLDDVWGIQSDITTRTVDTHIKRLREKLGAAGEYVETVRGVGYRFTDSPSEDA
jgi:two-component system, OmpR family, phosphate regulon response regulator PhoB